MKQIFLLLLSSLFIPVVHAQWTQVAGPAETTTNCFANNGTEFYVGNKGGIFQLNSTREEWLPIDHPLLKNVQQIQLDGPYVYALVDETYSTAGSGSYLVKGSRSDSDWSWEVVFEQDRFSVEYFEVQGENIFVSGIRFLEGSGNGFGARNEAYRTNDGGQNWDQIAYKKINQVFEHNQGLFSLEVERVILTRGRILHSPDWGHSWVDITPGGPTALFSLYQLGADVVAINNDHAFYLQEDLSWDTLHIDGLPLFQITYLFGDDSNWYVYNDYDRKYYWSTDRGANWQAQREGSLYVDHSFSDELVLVSVLEDLFVSFDNLQTLQPLKRGLGPAFETRNLMVNSQALIVQNRARSYISQDAGENWQALEDLGGPNYARGAIINDEFWINYREKFYLSSDQGQTWQSRFSGIGTGTEIESFQGKVLYPKYGEVFIASLNSEGYIDVTPTSPTNLNTVTAITSNDSLIAVVDVFGAVVLSADAGASWNPITSNLASFGANNFVFSLKMIGNRLFGLNSNTQSLLNFNFEDQRWEPIDLPSEVNGAIVFMEKNKNLFFLGVRGKGVFVSDDLQNWTNITRDLANLNLTSVGFQEDQIYLGVNGGSIWKRSVDDLATIIASVAPDIGEFTTLRMHPNPAANHIYLDLKQQKSAGKITIYKANGEMVEQREYSGATQVQLNIDDWAKGTYIVQVRVGRKIFLGKFVKN